MKRIFLILSITLAICVKIMYSQPIAVYLSPKLSINYPHAKVLREYYNTNFVLLYGGEIAAMYLPYKTGIYFQYYKYSFDIQDRILTQNSLKEEGERFSFGVIKKQNFKNFSIYEKIGIQLFADQLTLGENNKRKGFQIGIGVQKKVINLFFMTFDVNYTHNKLSVPEYRTFAYTRWAYSRHHFYLSGKNFNTGGLQIQFGVQFQLI
ncbi:MAG: hypothetical protein KAR38_03045 [Calditrichia bacterium]|nr:hypothetical protein [Calditrichia bacterium]